MVRSLYANKINIVKWKLCHKENMQTLCVCEQKDKNSNRNTVTVEM